MRTMLTGLTTDIRNTDGPRKTAIISRELVRLNVDIAALQETRLAGSGSLKEKEYTFFWHGKGEDEPREPKLDETIKRIPKNEALFLLGDFNARVGNDQESWPICLGDFGVDKCNENGQRLLELCSYHHLCVTNTFFAVKLRHRLS